MSTKIICLFWVIIHFASLSSPLLSNLQEYVCVQVSSSKIDSGQVHLKLLSIFYICLGLWNNCLSHPLLIIAVIKKDNEMMIKNNFQKNGKVKKFRKRLWTIIISTFGGKMAFFASNQCNGLLGKEVPLAVLSLL